MLGGRIQVCERWAHRGERWALCSVFGAHGDSDVDVRAMRALAHAALQERERQREAWYEGAGA